MALLDTYEWARMALELRELVRPFHVELLQLAAGESSRYLPVGVSFDLSDPNVLKAAEGLGRNIQGVSDTIRENAQKVVAQGLERGDSLDAIARALEEHLGADSERRAMLIARTETAEAYSEGAMLSYKAAGVGGKKWLASEGSCEECAGSDGEVVGIDETFSNGAVRPPLHPHCTCAVAPVVGGVGQP